MTAQQRDGKPTLLTIAAEGKALADAYDNADPDSDDRTVAGNDLDEFCMEHAPALCTAVIELAKALREARRGVTDGYYLATKGSLILRDIDAALRALGMEVE